jgi:hypothetical protein
MFLFIYHHFLAVLTRATTTTTDSANNDGKTAEMGPKRRSNVVCTPGKVFFYFISIYSCFFLLIIVF